MSPYPGSPCFPVSIPTVLLQPPAGGWGWGGEGWQGAPLGRRRSLCALPASPQLFPHPRRCRIPYSYKSAPCSLTRPDARGMCVGSGLDPKAHSCAACLSFPSPPTPSRCPHSPLSPSAAAALGGGWGGGWGQSSLPPIPHGQGPFQQLCTLSRTVPSSRCSQPLPTPPTPFDPPPTPHGCSRGDIAGRIPHRC